MSQEVFNLIQTCVLAPLLTAITGVIIAFITKQAERLKAKFESEQADILIDRAEKIVEQAVTSVSQTYVESLKKQELFDVEAQKKAFEKSKTLVYSLMKENCKKAVESNYINFDKWLETKIEEAVNNAK